MEQEERGSIRMGHDGGQKVPPGFHNWEERWVQDPECGGPPDPQTLMWLGRGTKEPPAGPLRTGLGLQRPCECL